MNEKKPARNAASRRAPSVPGKEGKPPFASPSPAPRTPGERLLEEQAKILKNTEESLLLLHRLPTSLASTLGGLLEQAEEARRENRRLREEAERDAAKLLWILDLVDDSLCLARGEENEALRAFLERIERRVLGVFSQVGLSEIPARGHRVSGEEHEVLEVVERPAGEGEENESGEIVEVVRRGFRYRGAVLRRAQVTVTR